MRLGLLIFLLAVFNAGVFLFPLEKNSPASVSFLDIGQGDSSLISSDGIDILVDAGPGKSILYELQRKLGQNDKYIDLIIISHPHKDHYGGLEYILSHYDIGAFIWNGANSGDAGFEDILKKIDEVGIPSINLFAGSLIKSESINLSIIYPSREIEEKILKDNDGSLVVLAKIDNMAGLFTGDIEKNPESILSAVNFPDIDFLKVPHHGSSSSSSQGFISAVRPAVGVVSVGRNSYGLPKQEIIERYASFGIPLYRTDKLGSITIEKKEEKLIIKSIN
jgi:competence protein ComEC